MNKNSIILTESQLHKIINRTVTKILTEEFHDKELNYSHFAVNKSTNLIVNGWDYHGYDSSELKADKKYYFDQDLEDYGFNPKEYKILSFNALIKRGIDPNDEANCWSNDGITPLNQEQK